MAILFLHYLMPAVNQFFFQCNSYHAIMDSEYEAKVTRNELKRTWTPFQPANQVKRLSA